MKSRAQISAFFGVRHGMTSYDAVCSLYTCFASWSLILRVTGEGISNAVYTDLLIATHRRSPFYPELEEATWPGALCTCHKSFKKEIDTVPNSMPADMQCSDVGEHSARVIQGGKVADFSGLSRSADLLLRCSLRVRV